MSGSLTNYVNVSITRATVASKRTDFGTAAYLSATADWAERMREYSDTDEVVEDFAEDSPEALAAGAYFSQDPHPETFKIARITPWTLVYVISVANVRDAHVYSAQVDGEGVTSTLAQTAASDGSATNDEIVALLVTALNAVAGNNYTAAATGAGGSQVVTVTGDAAGDWFSIEVDPDLRIVCTSADPGVATDLSAIHAEDPDFYAILNGAPSEAMLAAIATWAESRTKIFFAGTNQTTAVTGAVGGGDGVDDLKTADRSRSTAWYHPSPKNFLDAAIAGRYLAYLAGEASAHGKELDGVETVNLSSDQRDNLEDKHGNSYEEVAGAGVTFNGMTADGDFIDIIHFIDWWVDDVSKRIYDLIRAVPKIPYTNAGVAMVEGVIQGSIDAGIRRGGINGECDSKGKLTYSISFPRVEDVDDADKVNRLLPDGEVVFKLANAVHKVGVRARISL